MKFSKSELDIIYQYAAPTKAETLAGMKETVPVIKDLLTKAIVENAIRKLEKIPEPECSQFVAATKARFLAERDNSIRQRLAAAKAQEPIMQGHDLSGKERFHPETRHMITLEVQKQCFVGFKGSGSVSSSPMKATGTQNAASRRGNQDKEPCRRCCREALS